MKTKERPMDRVIIRPQTDDEVRRFGAATDLLLADIIRMVTAQHDGQKDETGRASEQEVHRSAPVQ